MCNAICCLGVSAVEDPESCRQRRSCSGLFHSHRSCKGGSVHLNTALAAIPPLSYGRLATERPLALSIFMVPVT